MAETVIEVKNLSKRYRIGLAEERHETLAQQIIHMLLAPIRNFKNLKSLSKFDNNDDESIFWALRDINFEVKKREVLGIIGHNGAGKSTLLKILSRITEPTEGEIQIKGRVSSLLEVGTGFHPDLTGRENVYMNGTILGMSKKEIDSKFKEIHEFSGIGKYIDTPVKRYSSGMKVRLAFSVAAHLDPEILIIDEVLAVGDAEFQKKCLGKMEDVAGKGRTVLFVSHNMAAVQSLCTKGILLSAGKVVYHGDINSVIQKYLEANRIVSKDGDIPDNIERPWGQSMAKFKKVIANTSNKKRNEYFVDEDINFTINIDSSTLIEHSYYVLIFTNQEARRIAYISNLEDIKTKKFILNEGNNLLHIITKNSFIPGKYYLSLRLINSNTNVVHDAIDEVVEFSVLSVSKGNNKPYPFKKDVAPIKLNSNWNVE